ncbi:MAG: hypothetical protein SGBAC_012677 [Bacillariaceae sp.]
MNVERIYIGGLDPPRLSGKDVIARLKSLDIEIHSIVDKENKCFIHLTATSSGDQSALSIISQKYNNVKWKGCRLSVAEARPHLLQRLEMERQERAEREEAQKKELKEPTAAATAAATDEPPNDEAKEKAPSKIPRRLRIRKKFGDEAFHVDTRPFSVDTWKRFHAGKKKLLQWAENHAEKAKKIKAMKNTTYVHAPLEHRALHIRFNTSSDSGHPKGASHAVSSSDEHEASEHDDGDDDDDDDDDDESEQSDSSDEDSDDESSAKGAKATKTGSYDWSDDDVAGDSSTGDDRSATDNMAPSAPQPAVVMKDVEATAPQNEYDWSSDSSSDESSVHITRTRTFQDVAVDDEFAAGLDDAKWNDSEEEDPVPASEKNATDSAYQMDTDLSANLGVLADLFPDMKAKTPAKKEDDEDAKQENAKPITKPSMPFGIMPRYDPTAATSQKYEVKEQESEDEESDEEEEEEEEVAMKGAGESDNGDRDSNDKEENGDNNEKEEVKEQIYQEGKLENVFREARDAWQLQSTRIVQKKEEISTGAFSFGFDLGSPEPKTETNIEGGFSFGFNVPLADKPSEREQELKQPKKDSDEEDGTSDDKMDVEDSIDSDPESNMKRRRGLRFSQAEMQSYEADFFGHNYGRSIIDDLRAFQNDQDDREQWLRERQSLTLDWKRKRKLAMSRIQKRVRHN